MSRNLSPIQIPNRPPEFAVVRHDGPNFEPIHINMQGGNQLLMHRIGGETKRLKIATGFLATLVADQVKTGAVDPCDIPQAAIHSAFDLAERILVEEQRRELLHSTPAAEQPDQSPIAIP